MSYSFSKGIGGAASGASTGFSVGGPIGGVIGGVAGLLGGFGSDIPDLNFSPEAMARLEQDFPEYALQIKSNQLAYGDLARQVAQIGPSQAARNTAREQQDMAQSQAAGGGQLGTAMGQQMLAQQENQRNLGLNEQAFNQRLQGMGQLGQMGQGLASQYGALGQMQNNARQQNIQNAMERDAAKAGRSLYGYEQGQQNNQNMMQNILNGGAMVSGAMQNPYSPWYQGASSESPATANAGSQISDIGMFSNPSYAPMAPTPTMGNPSYQLGQQLPGYSTPNPFSGSYGGPGVGNYSGAQPDYFHRTIPYGAR